MHPSALISMGLNQAVSDFTCANTNIFLKKGSKKRFEIWFKKLGESAFLAFAGRPSFCLFAKCPALTSMSWSNFIERK